MSDDISLLPRDNDPVPDEDQQIVDSITGSGSTPAVSHSDPKFSIHLLFKDLKSIIISSILFAVLSSPPTITIIKDFIPYARSSTSSLIAVQTLLFAICIFILGNIKYIINK